jgi:glycosyltransferase involved in cell wall biosynthesis
MSSHINTKLTELLKSATDVKSANQALHEMKVLVDAHPNDFLICSGYATLLEKSRAPLKVILTSWERAHQLNPEDLQAFEKFIKALMKSGEKNRALNLIDNSPLMKVHELANKLAFANLLHEVKEYERSEIAFEEVTCAFPKSDEAKILYAQRLRNRKLLFKARTVIQQIAPDAPLDKKSLAFVIEVKRVAALLESLEGKSLCEQDDSALLAMKHAMLVFENRDLPVANNKFLGKTALITGSLGPGGAERQLTRTAVSIDKKFMNGEKISGIAITEHMEILVKSFESERDNDFFLPYLRDNDTKVFQINDLSPVAVSRLGIENDVLSGLLSDVPNPVLYGVMRMVEHFRQAKTQVAFIWQDGAVLFAALAALIAGVPKIVLNMRGLPPNMRAHISRPEYHEMYLSLVRIPGVHFITNSRVTALAYCDWLKTPESLFTVVYNGVAQMAPEPCHDDDDEKIWHDFELLTKGATETIGAVFRFETDKRPILVIRLIKQYLLNHPDARFVLVGDGRLFNMCYELAQKFEISHRILFAGRRQSVGYWLSKMNALVLTSRYEGLPNVLIEAQFLGVPVVSTPAGGAAECFINGKTGYVLDSVEEPDLLDACEKLHNIIVKFKKNPKLKSAAKRFANEHFSISEMVENTVRALVL